MQKFIKSLIILLSVICLQIIVFNFFLKPIIFTWGATKAEIDSPLIGDELAFKINATRAITINAPIQKVWRWVIQLGADRGGFFSYTFIEKAMGYKTNKAELAVEKYPNMEVGRVIPGSLDQSNTLIEYSFPVVAVDTGNSFVLQEWGAFVLKKVNSDQTRLIIRTHEQDLQGPIEYIANFVVMPLHYLMERRMMMGFKARAETGKDLAELPDILWLLGALLSGFGFVFMNLISKTLLSYLLSAVYALTWLWALFIPDPKPVFSVGLSILVFSHILWMFIKNKGKSEV